MLEYKDLDENISDEDNNVYENIHKNFPHSSHKLKIPFEAYTGHKPDVSNFRVFGSTAWAKIPLDKR